MKYPANLTVTKSPQLAEVKVRYKTNVAPSDRPNITSSRDASKIFAEIWDEGRLEFSEEMYMLLLNRKSDVLGWVKLSSGGVAGTVMDPKVIFGIALAANASTIILAHNHPSGNYSPSNADMELTKKVANAGHILDIKLVDHLIMVVDNSCREGYTYYSFSDEGLMY